MEADEDAAAAAATREEEEEEVITPSAKQTKKRQPQAFLSSISEADFHTWTDSSLRSMIQDCHVMRVGIMQDAASFVDFMRTAYPYSSHWSEITPDEVRGAIQKCAQSVVGVVDEIIFPAQAAPPLSLSAFSERQTREAYGKLAEMRLAMEHLLLEILLRPRRRRNPLEAFVITNSVQPLSANLASPAEALFFFKNVYLAQFNQRARQWAGRDDDWARAAYLLQHPQLQFETAAEMRKYDQAQSEAEKELRGFAALTTTWAHECRLWHALRFDNDDLSTVVKISPNLFLTDRSTPSTEEVTAIEEFFKRMHWALPHHLPPEYGHTANGRNQAGDGHRLTLAHCLLGGAGFMPTILALAAAGDLPWVVNAPIGNNNDLFPGLRSVTLNATEGKNEADVRLALGLAKWLALPEKPDLSPRPPSLLSHTLRIEMNRISDLFLSATTTTSETIPEMDETGERGPAAPDLLLDTYLRRLYTGPRMPPPSPNELLANLLGIIIHLPALEALLPRIRPRLSGLDRQAIRAILITLLTNDILKTILGRLADPAGASELSSLDAYALSNGREAQLVSTAYFSFLAKSEARIPEWLRRGLREMRRTVASGNYGPIDDWMADDGGEPTHLPGIRFVTISMDAAMLISRFGLYAHLLEQYHRDWRASTTTTTATAAAPSSAYSIFVKFARYKLGLGRDEPSSPTMAQTDDFFSQTRMYDLDVVPSVYLALGHLTAGIAAFAHLFVLCGIPLSGTRLEKHCNSAALYGGVPSARVLEIWREGNRLASILGTSPYPARGPGPAIQVIQTLQRDPSWRILWNSQLRPRIVSEWLTKLEPWLGVGPLDEENMERNGPFYHLFMSLLRELPIWEHENALAFKHYIRFVLLSKIIA
jgi:hypothetical protein